MPLEITWNEAALALKKRKKKKRELELVVRKRAIAKKRAADEIEHQQKAGDGFSEQPGHRQSTSDVAREAKGLNASAALQWASPRPREANSPGREMSLKRSPHHTIVSLKFGRRVPASSNFNKLAREVETDADEEVIFERRRSTKVVAFGDNEV